MNVPDLRTDYPVHVIGDMSKSDYRWGQEEAVYFPCRTYDKDGNLIKEETRPPEHFVSSSSRLSSFDVIYRCYSPVGDGGGE